MLPHYDNFGRNPWTAAQTFSWTIWAKDFTTGIPGELLRLRIASSGFRGIYVDNVLLTGMEIPEPTTMALLGLGGLGLLRRRRRKA